MTTRTRTTAIMLAAAAILIAPACGESTVAEDSNASRAPSSPASAGAATITIDGFNYTAATVPPGAQVTVVNNDSAEHTVTSDASGAFNVEIDGKHRAIMTAPNQPGTYPFHCAYHSSMHGVLTVQ